PQRLATETQRAQSVLGKTGFLCALCVSVAKVFKAITLYAISMRFLSHLCQKKRMDIA
ncbi:MAG: hypothetical protein RL341_2063, partial [Pseudomonadota bacterium]